MRTQDAIALVFWKATRETDVGAADGAGPRGAPAVVQMRRTRGCSRPGQGPEGRDGVLSCKRGGGGQSGGRIGLGGSWGARGWGLPEEGDTSRCLVLCACVFA